MVRNGGIVNFGVGPITDHENGLTPPARGLNPFHEGVRPPVQAL